MASITLVGPFSQLLSMQTLPLKGALQDEQLPVITEAGLVLEGEIIKAVGKFEALRKQYPEAEVHQLKEKTVCLPGLVDAHTHICFGGSRARDFAMRNGGKSYLEIAKAGGGIWDTVTQTRQASQEDLTKLTVQRANRHLGQGVTTIEVKSGYGLSVEEELKMLRAIRSANQQVSIDLVPTCLAAHIKAKDFSGDHAAYLAHLQQELFPLLLQEGLTERIDIFIEEEAFTPEISQAYLKAARLLGFDLTVHADQFHPGGSAVAIAVGALSADHLEASTEGEIKALAESNVIATALPGASMGLGCAFTPARKILDAGGALAIASDWNPGSAPMGQLLTQACVLATFEKLSNAEIWAGLSFRAAAALNLYDRGRLVPSYQADFVLYPTDDYREITYQQGSMMPMAVWCKGTAL